MVHLGAVGLVVVDDEEQVTQAEAVGGRPLASAISSAASGVAKPPLTSRLNSSPLNRPRETAEVARRAPVRSASSISS